MVFTNAMNSASGTNNNTCKDEPLRHLFGILRHRLLAGTGGRYACYQPDKRNHALTSKVGTSSNLPGCPTKRK
jgi:hypothetical protein